ncbi:cold-shock protein [Bathymodiolus septemdierum thioautotrophic gill symbiont]|uniref:Cold shock protein n=1 Tax=endosymbiont of Bathymodiolus septemdierum str. Myojin knoll TaxID=1303921 RepID=A0A0P0UQX2_9GAMM|nr:cold shock domain-containing protein [Bathymodiolus septemdierum thioautotrophic gill symbiont]BAS67473.1 cold shock protein [endosymbiont of Bathymodiolus septemdierum str. Myojin knoll]
MATMKGEVSKFGTKGYGFIVGDDGEQYFVHQKNVFNKSRLNTGTRVKFKAENSDKGWVANEVELDAHAKSSNPKSASKPMSDGMIKGLFSVLFIAQAVVVYKIFLS